MQLTHILTALAVAVPALAMPASVDAISRRASAAGTYITCPSGYLPADSQVQIKGSNEYMDIAACCPKEYPALYYRFDDAGRLQCVPTWVSMIQKYLPTAKGTCTGKAKECKGHPNGCCTDVKDQVVGAGVAGMLATTVS